MYQKTENQHATKLACRQALFYMTYIERNLFKPVILPEHCQKKQNSYKHTFKWIISFLAFVLTLLPSTYNLPKGFYSLVR